MKTFSFSGGIHPPYNKELTNKKQIKIAEIPKQLIVPMVQHIGAPCNPTVNVGDVVKEGQLIGDNSSFVSAPIHAPVSGKIKKIEKALHPLGTKVTSVFIEPDGEDKKDYLPPLGREIKELNPKEMVSRIRKAGIVGLGGATFPAHVKFSPPKGKSIDTLIINGCECEPYLSADHRLMIEKTEDIGLGAQMIGKILSVSNIIIAIEENKPDAITAFSKRVKDTSIKCYVTKTKYPQGAEKTLIKAITNREVPGGGLPMDVGVVVSNVGTACSVCEAIRDGKPLIERVVTITGNGIKEPNNFLVRIGTKVSDLVEQAGGIVGDIGKLVIGGPMMGIAQSSFDIPVLKGTSGVLLMQREKYMNDQYHPCIKCSFCVKACPINLIPSTLSVIAEAKDWELAEKYGVNDCIECGSCDYVCPSKRPIVQLIKTAKLKLREIKAGENK